MFWLNADAKANICRADPASSTAQRTKPSPPAVPRHAEASYIAFAVYNDATSGASLNSVVATRHHVTFIDGIHKTAYR
jgi:hypothetical protein